MVTQIDCINAALKDSDDIHVDHIGTVRTYLVLIRNILSAGITPSMLERLASGQAAVAMWEKADKRKGYYDKRLTAWVDKNGEAYEVDLNNHFNPKHYKKSMFMTFNNSPAIPTPKGDSE